MKRLFCSFIFPIGVFIHPAVSAAEVDPLANPPTAAFEGQTGAPVVDNVSDFNMEVVVSDLARPRSLEVLPDGSLLVAEGGGTLTVISPDGSSREVRGVPTVRSVDDRGLTDIALAPDFAESRIIYLGYTAPPPGDRRGAVSPEVRSQALANGEVFSVDTIARARLSDNNRRLRNVEVIAELPSRRLLPASDGSLYISTVGAGGNRPQIQKLNTYIGKVLRINGDGSIPEDNPYYGHSLVSQEIFSVGHRDPDGMMIHPNTGEVWMVEHGPMGGDELNRILPGKNYGWPIITYGKNYDGTEIGKSARTGMEQPLHYWFPSRALSGLMMYTGTQFPQWQNNIFIGTMSPTQGKFMMRLVMDDNGDKVQQIEHLLVDHDRRVRDIAQGLNGEVFVLTDSENNTDLERVFPGEVLRLTP